MSRRNPRNKPEPGTVPQAQGRDAAPTQSPATAPGDLAAGAPATGAPASRTASRRRRPAAPAKPQTAESVGPEAAKPAPVRREADPARAPAQARSQAKPQAALLQAKSVAPGRATAPAAEKPPVKAEAAEPAAVKAEKPQKAEKPEKAGKKPKLVRDSFTLPESEYAAFKEMKARCLKRGVEVKKTELLRAALKALAALGDAELLKAVQGLERIKTGRPGK